MHSTRNGIEIEQICFLLWCTTPLNKDKLVMFETHISSSCLENVGIHVFTIFTGSIPLLMDYWSSGMG